MKKLNEVLECKQRNYILPFFWQHGESEEVLREYIDKIQASGIHAFCVEARPHPDFVGNQWWKDMDIIMEEARCRNMKVWVLDDSHFPTGYANGKIKDVYPEYRKIYLECGRIDVVGPMEGSSYLVEKAAGFMGRKGNVIGVVAGRKHDENSNIIDKTTIVDISNHIKNGVLYWDTPEGLWSIFVIFETQKGGEEKTKDYLNPIVSAATQVLIDEVYEAHYLRYKDDFGDVFAGFFSDEPRFGNIKGMFATIGSDMVLPWSSEMLDIMNEELNGEAIKYLPFLWNETTGKDSMVRYIYMNVVSELYAKNFSDKIGNWCKSHNVEYIGHVIEDNNAHARLGYGAGHYFRALRGQHMAGLDFVLGQVVPGQDKCYIPAKSAPGWDGEFFHYGLAKLGSSLAEIDKKKKGRTVCEMFGAYGWHEGLKLMKCFTDFMFVRGVNNFVPHAFNPNKFPDIDCPPHFYAKGNNPQYRYYKVLNDYTNRVAHLLNEGKSIPSVALLYHAESEWSGECMLYQKPARELTQNQIDFHIVPADIFNGKYEVNNSILSINDNSYKALIIPYSQYLPISLLSELTEIVNNNVPVIFIDDLPEGSSENEDVTSILMALKENNNCAITSLNDLTVKIKELELEDVEVKGYEPYLRAYHYRQGDGDIFMFFNEHPYNDINTEVILNIKNNIVKYDAFNNKIELINFNEVKDGIEVAVKLKAYESIILIEGINLKAESSISELLNEKDISIVKYKILLAKSKEYPRFSEYKEIDKLVNLAAYNELPNFTGTIRYESEFELSDITNNMAIDLGKVYEVAQVFVNEVDLGVKICPPYKFDISNVVTKGKNKLVVEITNTLVKEIKDPFSKSAIQEPTGLIGPIKILF